jgi:hypothetical protein
MPGIATATRSPSRCMARSNRISATRTGLELISRHCEERSDEAIHAAYRNDDATPF